MLELPPIKHCIQFNLSIAEALGDTVEGAAMKSVNGFLKRHGVPDGVPVKVEQVRCKYWYEITASWEDSGAELATMQR